MRLHDKVVLVTGSTNGIGEAIARLFIQEGAFVLLHGRDESAAAALCAEFGERAHYVIADLTDAAAPNTLINACIERFGRIDGLVNNAGLSPRSTIDSSDAALFDWVMALNLRAPLLLCQAAIQAFRKQGNGGVILNIGSINAYCGDSHLLVYSMSKGGLMTMTRNLGSNMSREKIRVNQLNVGWTATRNELELNRREGKPEGWEKQISPWFAPSGKLLSPEDIAAHALFWVSPESAPVSGAVYEVEQYAMTRNLISAGFNQPIE